MFDRSSESIKKKIADLEARHARLRQEIEEAGTALAKATLDGIDTRKPEATLIQRESERLAVERTIPGLQIELDKAIARENENARLARIAELERERAGLRKRIDALGETVAAALRIIERDEGPRRRAIAEDTRHAIELRRLGAPAVADPYGLDFRYLIEPAWTANALGAEHVQLDLYSACDPDETIRTAKEQALRNAAQMTRDGASRPTAPARPAPSSYRPTIFRDAKPEKLPEITDEITDDDAEALEAFARNLP